MSTDFNCKFCGKFLPTAQGLKSHVTRLHKAGNTSQTSRVVTSQPLDVDPSHTSVVDDLPTELGLEGFLSRLASIKASVRIVRRLPKGARFFAATALSDVIDAVVSDNSVMAWKRLFLFAGCCFGLPGAHAEDSKVSLATIINRNIKRFSQESGSNPPTSGRQDRVARTASGQLPVKIIEGKLAEGDVSGAVRILCSEAEFAPFDENHLSALMEVHPAQPSDCCFPDAPPPLDTPPFTITVNSVKGAIASFPMGSAGGYDLLRPQHLKDLTGHSAGVAGSRLLNSLVKLCALILKGLVPPAICPFIFGASLCALKKKDGGVRPIAVGCVFRRLVAKLCCTHVSDKLRELFQPVQLGFGTRGGAEAIAHAARRFVSFPHLAPKVLLKLDFSNAFNSVRRDVMLTEVAQHLPELLPFLGQCYLNPSHLLFGSEVISSASGIQQGDPLGPALFCLAVNPVASKLHSELNLWFMDDATLGGSLEDVHRDFQFISRESDRLGLQLNTAKCEIFSLDDSPECVFNIQRKFRDVGSHFRFPPSSECTLLGAPLTPEAIPGIIEAKIEDFKRLSSRLPLLSAHYAFFVLRNSLAVPRLVYTLRCAPTWKAEDKLLAFDSALFTTVQEVTNICLTETSIIQSTLPVSEGGLGIRKASSLATPAFLSSTSSVGPLLSSILPAYISALDDPDVAEGIGVWTAITGHSLPSSDISSSQSAWECGINAVSRGILQDRALKLQDKARLLSVSAKEAGAFLQAIPSPQLGTFLDDNTLRIALSLRLGLVVCRAHTCHCGSDADEFGLHGLSCRASRGRFSRHAAANDIIRRALVSAGYPVTLEPSGLSPDSNLRPDGITLTPWAGGKALVWDFTCVDAQAACYLASSAGTALHAANAAECGKKRKYVSLENSYNFSPIAVECLGAFGRDSLRTLKMIGKRINTSSGEKRASGFFFQRLSVAIQKGNAAAVSGSLPQGVTLDDFLSNL